MDAPKGCSSLILRPNPCSSIYKSPLPSFSLPNFPNCIFCTEMDSSAHSFPPSSSSSSSSSSSTLTHPDCNNNEPMQRICILGGGGYLGQLLAASLQRDGHFVVLLDLHHPCFPHISVDPSRSMRITGSILDLRALREALAGCHACFHLAGFGMSGGASLDRDQCFLVNVEGTRRVLEECARAGVARMVYTSSVLVIFDGRHELHMADERETEYVEKAMNAYGESKCVAERMVLGANNPRLATCALRLRGIYGPGELRTVKRSAELCRSGIVKCTFGRSCKVLTQYSGAENTAQALVLAERSLRKGQYSAAAGQAYHIVDGGEPVDSFEFWYPLISAIGCPLPSFRIPFRLAYLLGFLFELLYRTLGWEPLFTRCEISLMGITNTYSIVRAKRDLGYQPGSSSDQLQKTIDFLKDQLEREAETKRCPRSGADWLRKRRWMLLATILDAVKRNLLSAKCPLLCLLASCCVFLALLAFHPALQLSPSPSSSSGLPPCPPTIPLPLLLPPLVPLFLITLITPLSPHCFIPFPRFWSFFHPYI